MPARFKVLFDPELARAMRRAFDGALKSLVDSGSPYVADDASNWARETLALRIIDKAKEGEKDVDRLRNDALEFLANSEDKNRA